MVLFVLVLIGIGVNNYKALSPYPPDVANALNRIESIPSGMLQKDIFQFLGLCIPQEGPSREWMEGRSGRTWSRYRIGTEFALECESQIRPASDDDVASGILLTVTLRRIEKMPDGSIQYISLTPRWQAAETLDQY